MMVTNEEYKGLVKVRKTKCKAGNHTTGTAMAVNGRYYEYCLHCLWLKPVRCSNLVKS